MKTRKFGNRCGYEIAGISMGAMRFPKDTGEAATLIRHGIDSGMRYIDTCRRYGESELKLKEALQDGYREKVVLSTKWAPWNDPEADQNDTTATTIRKKIEQSLERLGVDHLDFYQAWDIRCRERYDKFTAKGGMLEGIMQAKEDGLLKHTGMTTHDTPENVIKYINESEWIEVLLVSYNMLNREHAPTLREAKRLGIGTLVMNPVGGGLFDENTEQLTALAEKTGAISVADMAIRYILSNPDINTALIGISKISDVDNSIATESRRPLTPEAIQEIDRFFDKHRASLEKFCSKCGYCMPCPQGINIPAIMHSAFLRKTLGIRKKSRVLYVNSGEKRAESCNECGICEKKCTQKLEIREYMKYASEKMEEKVS